MEQKRSVLSPEDFKNPEKIHKEMLAAQRDFERVITETKNLHLLNKEIYQHE